MMWFALKLLGAGRAIASTASMAAKWLSARWYRLTIAALVLICLWLWFALSDVKDERDAAIASLAAEKVAHADFILSVAEAAKEAERRAIRNAERVRAEYAAKAEEASHENERLAADYRSRAAEFVRRQRPAADSGRPGATDLPGATALPAGPMPDAGFAIVPDSDLDRCAVGFAQLEALIGYVKGVSSTATVSESPDASNP